MRQALAMVLLSYLLVLPGCGETGPVKHPVSGSVTFDKDPLPEGDILFTPVADSEPPEGGKIKEGRFQLRVREGSYKVAITASKLMPLPPGETGAMGEKEMPRSYIPERYNTKTELTAEVTRSGTPQLKFDLRSR